MIFLSELKKILPVDYADKGLRVKNNPLGLSVEDAKRAFDEMNLDVIIPIFNELVEALNNMKIEERVPSLDIKGLRLNADGVIEVTKDGEIWEASGSSGHLIFDKDGVQLPQRARLKFANSFVTDDGTVTIVNGIKGDKGEKGEKGEKGDRGIQGVTGKLGPVIVPSIDSNGVMSFSIQDTAIAPNSVSIRGPQGPQGVQGSQGATGPPGLQGIQGPQGVQGVTGPKGDTGETGLTGLTGAQGAQGPMGPQGLKGDDGADGRSFTILGLYPTLFDLQTVHRTGNPGEAYAVGTIDNNYVYIWDTIQQAWQNIGQLQGPQGPQGIQGIKGDTGPQGPAGVQGIKGDTGVQGIQGIQGPIGPQGQQGIQGVAGTNGKSAYTTAVEGGYSGTETAFVASLALVPDHMADKTTHITAEERNKWNDVGKIQDDTTQGIYSLKVNNGLLYLEQVG